MHLFLETIFSNAEAPILLDTFCSPLSFVVEANCSFLSLDGQSTSSILTTLRNRFRQRPSLLRREIRSREAKVASGARRIPSEVPSDHQAQGTSEVRKRWWRFGASADTQADATQRVEGYEERVGLHHGPGRFGGRCCGICSASTKYGRLLEGGR